MLKILLITLLILALAVAGIAIKMFVKRDGEFKKSCSGVDPSTGQKIGCTCGNSDGGSQCANRSEKETH